MIKKAVLEGSYLISSHNGCNIYSICIYPEVIYKI